MCITTYLVDYLCVGFSQDEGHSVSFAGEFEVAGVLTVSPLSQSLASLLRGHNIKRANGDPSHASKPFQIGSVDRLRKTQMTMMNMWDA